MSVFLKWCSRLALTAACATGCATKYNPAPGAGSAGATSVSTIAGAAATSAPAGPAQGSGTSTPSSNGNGGSVGAAASGTAGTSSTMPAGGASGAGVGTQAAAGSGAGPSPMASAGTTAVPIGGAGGGVAPVMQTCPATSTLKPGDSMGTMQVGNYNRDYIVHVPKNYTGQTPVPLVADFHGILTDDSFQQSLSGYQEKSEKEGFIVVFPNGIDSAWNVGWCCTSSKDVDDVAFARALVMKLETQACIDPKRVYAVGYSMGGGMALKLGCDAADLFAAIAPSAFDLMTENEWPCHPSRPITIIQFRGTADPIVPYEGGPTNPPNGLPITVDFIGAEANFMKWAMFDGCTGSPTMGSNGCRTYSQCQEGAEVTLCTTQGGSHDFGDPDIGWDMLKKHPLP